MRLGLNKEKLFKEKQNSKAEKLIGDRVWYGGKTVAWSAVAGVRAARGEPADILENRQNKEKLENKLN